MNNSEKLAAFGGKPTREKEFFLNFIFFLLKGFNF